MVCSRMLSEALLPKRSYPSVSTWKGFCTNRTTRVKNQNAGVGVGRPDWLQPKAKCVSSVGEGFICSEMLGRKHKCTGACAHVCEGVHTLTHSEVEGSGHLQTESTILWEHGTCVKGPDLAGEGEQGPIQCFPLPGRAGEVPVQERTVVEGVTPILRLRFP